MQIYTNAQQAPLNFGMMRIRQIDGTTRRIEAKGGDTIWRIWGDVMKKGKCVEKFNYENEEGFDEQDLAEIVESLCKNAKNKRNAINTTLAYLYANDHSIDYNA